MKSEETLVKEHLKEITARICRAYPDINRDALELAIEKLNIVDSNDLTDTRPVVYDFMSNSLRINYDALQGDYDAEYLMATNLLALTLPYSKELEGIRYGFFAGLAASSVGNFIKEAEDELYPGIDPYEPLRLIVQEMSGRIGPDLAVSLCTARTAREFKEMCAEIGIQDVEQLTSQANYLLQKSLAIEPEKSMSIASEVSRKIPLVEVRDKVHTNNRQS